MKRKPLSKQKCVLRKCCGVSQKWWMLELSNHCHCVWHPWKLTSRDFWSFRNAPNTPLTPPTPPDTPKWPHPLVPQGGVTYLIETRQVTQMSYAAVYKHVALFAVTIYNMYIHHIITYSCTKSIKMLWGLFLPLTNLVMSFHQQSSVLLHQSTTFIHLQLSSLCNWPSSWLHPLHNILSWVTFVVLCSSGNFCNISQNMHSKAPVASQNKKTNKVVYHYTS